MSDLWKRVADFFKEWDGEDMTTSMPLCVDELREINSNRIELIRLERERKEIREKTIEKFAKAVTDKIVAKYCRCDLTSQYIGMQTCDWIKEIAEKMRQQEKGGYNE